jgi:DHA1 family multidrug resistance protein-like MFS transporter
LQQLAHFFSLLLRFRVYNLTGLAMWTDIIRDAPFGQLLRYATGNRVLRYPEELPDFQCPHVYKDSNAASAAAHPDDVSEPEPAHLDLEKNPSRTADVEKAGSTHSADSSEVGVLKRRATVPDNAGEQIARVRSLPYNNERLELEQELAQHATHATSVAVVPTKTADGTILVDWYTTDDPANPQNCTLHHSTNIENMR